MRAQWATNVRLFTHPKRPSRYSLITRAADHRLSQLAHEYSFHVIAFRYLSRAQAAALTIQTAQPRSRFARTIPAIQDALDPQHGNAFSYRGFALEVRDARGVPFIALQRSIHNARGQIEGQQWARSEPLLPFAHG